MFNSLLYAKRLEEAGFTREQVEVHVQIVTEIIETTFATTQDLKDLKNEIKIELSNIENKIIQSEYRQTIKLGTIVSVAIGVAVTLVKLIS